MIKTSLHDILTTTKPNEPKKELIFVRVFDTIYNDNSWLRQVRFQISQHINSNEKGAIIGYDKDETSYYIKKFPNLDVIEANPVLDENNEIISAVNIRDFIYKNIDKVFKDEESMKFYAKKPYIDYGVLDIIKRAEKLEHLRQMAQESQYYEDYQKPYKTLPYPVKFPCSDGIVIQSGHVLLVKRKNLPGKGLWAIPGGFLDEETTLECALRELREETGLKIAKKVLQRALFNHRVFDHPKRSLRGHVISHSFGFRLDDTQELPKLKACQKETYGAEWIPFEVIQSNEFRSQMFEDHYDILEWYIKQEPKFLIN